MMRRPARRSLVLLGLALLVLLLGVAGYRRWIEAHTANPPMQASALHTRLSDHWQALSTIGPRTLGSTGHQRALAYLQAQFQAFGYRTETTTFDVPQTHDAGSVVLIGAERLPARALEGSGAGDQRGPLLDLRRASGAADVTAADGSDGSLSGKIVLLSCRPSGQTEMISEVFRSGGFGVILADTCPVRAMERGDGTPLPVVVVSPATAQRLASVTGRAVQVTAHVVLGTAQGTNLVAFRDPAQPTVLLTAPLAPHAGSLGADAGGSGVLTLLDTARRAASSPLADRLWFAVLDGDEDGRAGEEVFVSAHRYVLRSTRAALVIQRVGLGSSPLRISGPADLVRVARATRPGVTAREVRAGAQGSALDRWQIRILHLTRAGTVLPRTDETLDTGRVQDASEFIAAFLPKLLAQPWTAPPICDGIGKQDSRC
ncbi:M28 family metallopeptidase [Deinococcus sp. UYEF24]